MIEKQNKSRHCLKKTIPVFNALPISPLSLYDGRVTETAELASFDGARVRAQCENDHELGYQLMLASPPSSSVACRRPASNFSMCTAVRTSS